MSDLTPGLVTPGLDPIVVPGTRIAYLARIAFSEGEDRVFYDDIDAARAWLREGGP